MRPALTRRPILPLAIMLLSVSVSLAQPVADRVPDDALVYVAWRGAQSPPPGYEKTHLKALLDSSNLPQVFNEVVPRLLAKIAEKGGAEAAQAVSAFNTIAPAMWRHPTAYYVALDVSGPEPRPRVALICRAGKDAAALHQVLEQLFADAPHGPLPMKTFLIDDVTGFTVGVDDPAAALAERGGGLKPLNASTAFANALAKTGIKPDDAMFVVHVDGENLLQVLDTAVEKHNQDPNFAEKWPKIREASGLTGFKRMVLTAGFDGADWATNVFVESPSPRKGLLTVLDSPPVSDELLKRVPVTATSVSAFSFDPAKFLTDLRAAAGEVDPQFQTYFDQGMGAFKMYVFGKDLINDILAPLGPSWVAYTDPNTAGYGWGGLVIVNKLDDPAKAQSGLSNLATAINNSLGIAKQQADVTVEIRSTTAGDVKVNYFATPLISPSWAIKDGYLYAGLYPQPVISAARRGAPQQSILDNKAFQEFRKRFGTERPGSITFNDLPRTTPLMYPVALAVSRTALGAADLWGLKAPAMVLPPMEELLKHVAPSGSASWSDESGFYMKSVTPFPGASVLSDRGGGLGLVAATAIPAGVVLPSIGRARETAMRQACSSNMRQIGVALALHANENGGNLPPDLGTLVVTQEIAPQVFVCPASPHQVPPNFAEMAPEEKVAWINANSTYTYAGAGKKIDGGAGALVLYDRDNNHNRDGMNLLFADGSVQWRPLRQARELIRQQTGR